jgi:16S rRNA (guanine1207-N2)-methyltransferase
MILSNPPFHEGARVQTEKSTALLHSVRNFLNPGGQLILVVNRHLPYRKWLDAMFGGSETLASNDRFQVLRAVNESQR